MPSKPIKILAIHGYTQSGPQFHAKTKALEKHLQKSLAPLGGVELVYPTGPMRLQPSDLPTWDAVTTADTLSPSTSEGEEQGEFYGWWRKFEFFTGLPSPCLDSIYEIMEKQGPFDGVIGFSQGGALAGMLASLLEPHRRSSPLLPSGWPVPPANQPPLVFSISYSGNTASEEQYNFVYEPKIKTPMLHFIGTLDTVVDEEKSLALVRACEKERVVYHPGGHYLPGAKMYLNAAVQFVMEALEEKKKSLQGVGDEEGEVEEDIDALLHLGERVGG